MSKKKDELRKAMGEFAQKTKSKSFKGIKPMSLDDIPLKTTEQPTDQTKGNNAKKPSGKAPRKKVKTTLTKRAWGKKQTIGYKFEITPELKDKLFKRQAEMQLATGKKVSASEIIRNALAKYLREL